MAETLTLEAAPRSAERKQNKALRREGKVPLHVFGRGTESLALEAEEHALRQVLQRAGSGGLIRMTADGQSHNVLVRHVQRHPVTHRLIHVDLYQVRMDEKTRVRLPLVFVGEAPGVTMHDGMLLHQLEALSVEALPGDLPHSIELDVSGLTELDQALHVRDIKVPATLSVLDDPDEIVVKIQPPRVEAPVAAAPAAETPAAEAGAPAEGAAS